MQTWRIPIKLVITRAMWGAGAYALLLVGICLLLEPWHFVEKVQVEHIRLLYGIAFPPVAAFMYSQIFAADVEELALQWVRALPHGRLYLFVERWLVGTVLLLVFYFASLWIVHSTVIRLPWNEFAFDLLVPSLWLGQLGMLGTLTGKMTVVGMALPLLYWVVESVSRGAATGQLYLFTQAFGASPAVIAENRVGLLGLAAVAWIASAAILYSRYYHSR